MDELTATVTCSWTRGTPHRSGRPDAARPHLEEAVHLRPESWSFRRQAIVLSDPALTGQVAATPEYWQAVMSLGDGPIDMKGMPPPFRRERGRATGECRAQPTERALIPRVG